MKYVVETPMTNNLIIADPSIQNGPGAVINAVVPDQTPTECFFMVEGDDNPNISDIRTGIQSDGKQRISLIRFTNLPSLDPHDTLT